MDSWPAIVGPKLASASQHLVDIVEEVRDAALALVHDVPGVAHALARRADLGGGEQQQITEEEELEFYRQVLAGASDRPPPPS